MIAIQKRWKSLNKSIWLDPILLYSNHAFLIRQHLSNTKKETTRSSEMTKLTHGTQYTYLVSLLYMLIVENNQNTTIISHLHLKKSIAMYFPEILYIQNTFTLITSFQIILYKLKKKNTCILRFILLKCWSSIPVVNTFQVKQC